jgi:hypothetical protein
MFLLLYKVPGLTYTALDEMDKRERNFWMKMLADQLQREAEAWKNRK